MNVKPIIPSIPIAQGRAWRGGDGWRFERKYDGQYHTLPMPHLRAVLIGELVKPGRADAPGFYAYDLTAYEAHSCAALPLSERLTLLDDLWPALTRTPTAPALPFRCPASGSGGEFLEAVLAHGGEGVIAKPLHTPFGGGWLKCKRTQIFPCQVGALDHWTSGVELLDPLTGEARGKMPLRGGKFDQVRRGSLLKIEAYGLTAAGRLREARPCADTPTSWLISY